MKYFVKLTGLVTVLASLLLLTGCEFDVLKPAGYIAQQQLMLIIICVAVMLCVVIPVMIAVVYFAIKYRATNTKSEYLPDWGHSKKVETYMWGIPIVIVTILGAMTVYYTFKLEPSKVISQEIAGDEKPLQIDVVALDWKWLFIYPEYGVASINEIYAPKGRQVFLQISSESAINAFWVPKLGSLIYAMPQMNAKLHLIADEDGVFYGRSANYSGDGFATMHFKWHSVPEADFNQWIETARQSGNELDRQSYQRLAVAPKMGDVAAKEKDAEVRYFSHVDPNLYYRVVNRCVVDGTTCNEDQMKLAAAQTLWGELCSVFDPGVIQRQ
ncbi:ubiquinol oxidase subunit II [Bartonella tamiae]|uniref:Ubiquinol oxidase subunit 2 n=1 Tax=Bartonella tamiae Th239 TaxID=1094558 RepID=J0QYQ2_9HYPH|nr:ubiquinol oxidase subunit II [Bartonella tamiae]EJF91241.1 ubiquinol oxidase, subunit II [Bartonella tamiae Th239]EJF93094.1 ubiquinol oxidase, subunit II [Bartonella tamiae Th307]